MRQRTTSNRHRQHGSVLIVAMMLLMVLTILGITSMNDMTMEERMASGFQKMQQASDGALSAINITMATSMTNRGVPDVDPLYVPPGICGQAQPQSRANVVVDNGVFNGGTTVAQMTVVYRGASAGLVYQKGSDGGTVFFYDIHSDASVKVAGLTTGQSTQIQTVDWQIPGIQSGDDCLWNKDEPAKLKL